jgi:uncharacterized protein YbaP (TraB family)
MRLLSLLGALAAWSAASADPAARRVVGQSGGEVVLLGSIHVLRAADYPLPESIDALLANADVVTMELDLDDVDAVAQQATLLQAALLAPGTVLRDVVDPAVYRVAEQRSREIGMDLAQLERFEPWFVAITMLDQGLRRLGFQAERGLEQYLVGKALQSGKEILGLETLAFQIGIFDALPAQAQQSLLEQTLHELDGANVAMTELTDAWRAGRLDALSERLLEDFEDFPGLYETLVKNRNSEWLESFERYLRDGRRHLVVVGALHLVGRDNVIDLLEARGHEVARLP